MNYAVKKIAYVAMVMAAMAGLYAHVDYSGWVLCIGCFLVLFD